jgi:hypothetical protein
MSALPTLVALEPAVAHEAIKRRIAARASKAIWPADLCHSILTLDLCPIELQEIGQGQALLELNGIASHGWSGICVPH